MSWPEAWASMGNTTHYAPDDPRKSMGITSTFWDIQEKGGLRPEGKGRIDGPGKPRNLAYVLVEQEPTEGEYLGRMKVGRSYPSGSYSETCGHAYFNGVSWHKDANWDSTEPIEWFVIVDLDVRNEQKERMRFPGHKWYKD
jgi:hypothetical protein